MQQCRKHNKSNANHKNEPEHRTKTNQDKPERRAQKIIFVCVYVRACVCLFHYIFTLSALVVAMFPPVAAARSTVTLPTFIECTIGWLMDG